MPLLLFLRFVRTNADELFVQEIDSTVNVMRNNINKVSERGERLDSLQDKTDNLAVSAQGFRRGANRVRKQMWWKDMKMRMCLIIGIIILLVIIIVPSGMSCPNAPSRANQPANNTQSSQQNITRAIRPRCVFDEMTLEACEASDNEARVLYHFATIPLVYSNPSDTTICSDCT
ncbi:hypothetical protein D6D27_05309 [Aureobasidium pullulans]|nr:hypothetical protein D6D27_05309 [Aureobasidium pullulans]